MQWTVRFAVSSSCFFLFRSLWIQCCLATSFSTSWRTMWARSSSVTSTESSTATVPATRSTTPQSRSRSENSLVHSSWARDKKKYLTKVQNLYKSVVPQCRMQLSVTPQLLILFSFLKLPGCENWAVKIWSGKERPGNYEAEKDNFTMGGKERSILMRVLKNICICNRNQISFNSFFLWMHIFPLTVTRLHN